MIMMRSFKVTVFLTACCVFSAHAINLQEHPKVKVVADKLVTDGHYSQIEIEQLFSKAEVQQSVLDAMMNPAEYKFTWGKYRKIFLKEDRIQQGAEFWQKHQASLARAEKEYGVPASIIVAIIGVESKFGAFKGRYKVLDSLVSLVTGFPRRSQFFASELEQFLILTKENQLTADEIFGSYAGAVGYPQFISSSYRNYAVDFNHDGRIDLINQVDDAIGSIANYFIENGWKTGEPVTSIGHKNVNDEIQALSTRKRKVAHSAASLRTKGATLDSSIADEERLGVLMLDASEVVHDEKTDTYIVRAGDTACRIAERFKVSCKALFSLNKLNRDGDIFRGQRLTLPTGSVSQAVAIKDSASKTKKQAASTDSKWEVSSANASSSSSPSSSSTAKQQTSDSTYSEKSSEKDSGPQPLYFYTHRNFYAITQYNHSVLYAMAVYDLSRAINHAYAAQNQ